MSAQILDGKILAKKIKDQLTHEVIDLKKKFGITPHLVNVLVGDDPGSCAYANSQKKIAEQIGIRYTFKKYSDQIELNALLADISALEDDVDIHGIMLLKPLPKHFGQFFYFFDKEKDWEGVFPANLGDLLLGETKIIPCTPASVMELIRSTNISIRGKEAVIVGRSAIVGKPVSLLLLNESATVTICHGGTFEAGKLIEHIGRADILVVAMGKPQFIKGEWIKKGAVVIDVGINRVGNKIVGDVEFEEAQKRAGFITPVPGGVGPLTVLMLMKNGIESFKQQMNAFKINKGQIL